MTLNRIRAFTLCTASLYSVAMFAQTPAASTPDSGTTPVKSPDKMFLHRASEGGYAEVQLGQLAVQKGNSDEVKKFGQRMVDDHTALNAQLKPFADSMGVPAPTKLDKKDQAEYDKLNGLSGDAFDKEYIAFMVKDHHADLREFRHEEATTTDASLKDAVSKGEAVIKEHTEMATKLAKEMGVPVPTHKGVAASGAE